MADNLAPLRIFPIFSDDFRIDRWAAYIQDRVKIASYSPGDHMILLNIDSCETHRFMASSLLHEVGHACAAEKERRILSSAGPRDEIGRLEEELRMWHFDVRLAMLIGGEKLRFKIDAAVREIVQQLSVKGSYLIKLGVGQSLDLCYGPALSNEASLKREYFYAVYCGLIALHEYLGPQLAHEPQLAIIRQIHQEFYKKDKDYIQSLRK
jgi:hypothetical protein